MRIRPATNIASHRAVAARVLALAAALALGAPCGHALGAQTSHAPHAHPAPPATKPARDTAAVVADSAIRDSTEVTAVARRHAGVIRNCYQEQGLKADPALRGLLRVELTVLPAGEVQAATATATEVNGTGMPAVTACVSTAARSWRFSDGAPRPERVVLEYDLLPPQP